MANTALNRTLATLSTNKSGGAVAFGDVVVIDLTTDSSFTTTAVLGYTGGIVGVVLEPDGIAGDALGMVAYGGWVPQINLSAAGTWGDLVRTSGTAKIGVRHAAPVLTGDFAVVWGDQDDPPAQIVQPLPVGIGIDTFLGYHLALPIFIPRI
jgi:hypothetical protein